MLRENIRHLVGELELSEGCREAWALESGRSLLVCHRPPQRETRGAFSSSRLSEALAPFNRCGLGVRT